MSDLAWWHCVQYPHIFEEEVLASIKNWVVEDSPKPAVEGPNGMAICHSTRNCFTTSDAMDREILRTYATGLLAVALGGYHYSPNLFTSIDHLGFCCKVHMAYADWIGCNIKD
jgi:hypothetical protein